jgi:hypothetical protein
MAIRISYDGQPAAIPAGQGGGRLVRRGDDVHVIGALAARQV